MKKSAKARGHKGRGGKKKSKAARKDGVRYTKFTFFSKVNPDVLDQIEDVLQAVGDLVERVPGIKMPRKCPIWKMCAEIRNAIELVDEAKWTELYEREETW